MPRFSPFVVFPPVAALLIAGIGYSFPRQSLRTLEQENKTLRQEIRGARQDHDGAGAPSLSESMAQKKESARGKTLDWKGIAARLSEAEGPANVHELYALQQQLEKMSVKDLVAAYEEIKTLDLPENIRRNLEYSLADAMAAKDPKEVTELLGTRVKEQWGPMSGRVSTAFQKWSEKDPTAAITWLDHEIDAGSFDSKTLDGSNIKLVQLQAALVRSLLSNDPATADQRIGAMAEKDRLELFQGISARDLKPGTAQSYAELVRKYLPAKDQAERLATAAQVLILGEDDYGKVDKFMGEISATREERSAIMLKTVQYKVTSSDKSDFLATNIEQARNWAMKQNPAEADAITGAALGEMSGKNFKEASKLALQYHETGGSDDLLMRFIESQPTPTSKEEILPMVERIRPLVERIRDPQKREEMNAKLGGLNQKK